MAAPTQQATEVPQPISVAPGPTVGSLIADPTILGDLRHAGAGPFLDVALPQLPPMPELPQLQLPTPQQLGQDLSHLFAPPPEQPVAATAPGASTGLPQLPPLPANPIDALMQGLALPGLPGVDQLMAPILSLLNSVGSGVMQALNPADLIKGGAQAMETAMGVGSEALQAVMQGWNGDAATSANGSGQQAAAKGNQVAQQGRTISDITNRAADTVNRGYQQLTGIAQQFAATAVPIATSGLILTPPGQGMLMAAATKSLAAATTVVSRTEAALGGLSADIGAAGGLIQILENSGVDLPTIANQVLSTAQPVVSQVSDAMSHAVDDLTSHSGDNGPGSGFQLPGPGSGDNGSGSQLAAASYVDAPIGATPGGLGGAGLGGLAGGDLGGGAGLGGGGVDPGGDPAPPNEPLSEPTLAGGGPPMPQGSAVMSALSPASATTNGAAPSGAAPMGGGVAPAAPGRGNESQHHRTVQPYQAAAHHLTAGMQPVPPSVLGAEDPETDARYESEYGYYDSSDATDRDPKDTIG